MRARTGRVLVIPAAGRGSRLQSDRPKALVRVAGRPMLDWLLDLYRSYIDRIVVVAHPCFRREVERWGEDYGGVDVVEQPSPTGMLDAILLSSAAAIRSAPDWVWITWCDQIGVMPATVAGLVAETSARGRALVLPTVRQRDPYIHFERDASGRIARVLQRREGDAMPAEGESDMGLFALTRRAFEHDLQLYSTQAGVSGGTGERNFLPFIPWLAARGDVATFPSTDPMEALGVNTPQDMQMMEQWLRERPR